jgi:hypothetical protein
VRAVVDGGSRHECDGEGQEWDAPAPSREPLQGEEGEEGEEEVRKAPGEVGPVEGTGVTEEGGGEGGGGVGGEEKREEEEGGGRGEGGDGDGEYPRKPTVAEGVEADGGEGSEAEGEGSQQLLGVAETVPDGDPVEELSGAEVMAEGEPEEKQRGAAQQHAGAVLLRGRSRERTESGGEHQGRAEVDAVGEERQEPTARRAERERSGGAT